MPLNLGLPGVKIAFLGKDERRLYSKLDLFQLRIIRCSMKKAILFLSVPAFISAFSVASYGISGYQGEANQMILNIAENNTFNENINILRTAAGNEDVRLKKQLEDLSKSIAQLEFNSRNKTDKVKSLLFEAMTTLNTEYQELLAITKDVSSNQLESFLVKVQQQVSRFKANPDVLSKANQDVILKNMCETDSACVQVYRTLNGQRPTSEVFAVKAEKPTHFLRLSDHEITKVDEKSDKVGSCAYGSPLSTINHYDLLNPEKVETLDRVVQRGTLNILCRQSRFRGPWAKYSADTHTVDYMIDVDYGQVTITHNPKVDIFNLMRNSQ